jgi:hypothetical protein
MPGSFRLWIGQHGPSGSIAASEPEIQRIHMRRFIRFAVMLRESESGAACDTALLR